MRLLEKINWKGVPRRDKVRFITVMVVYLAWTVWVGCPWLLLGVPVIFDAYVTRKVHWCFWKRRDGRNSVLVEWVDALIFALVFVSLINIFLFQMYKIPSGSMEKTLLIGDHLYVSKLKYGPRIPNTPLAFPFAQHTMPGTANVRSYVEWIHWPYRRLKGFGNVERGDIVVFNFPEGDTVVVENQAESYYSIVRDISSQLAMSDLESGLQRSAGAYDAQARAYLRKYYTVTVRPTDRRDNYVKRCVALPGDTLEVIGTRVYINGKPFAHDLPYVQFRRSVTTDGTRINPKTLEKMGVYQSDVIQTGSNVWNMPLSDIQAEQVAKMSGVQKVEKTEEPEGRYNSRIFPHNAWYPWNEDYLGPLWIPSKGATVRLTAENLCIYERIITAYEGHALRTEGDAILIDGVPASTYTFAMDYYFMMGDNRHDSADSRYWGFVPEDHIVGAPSFVWFSLNKEKKFPFSIRWNRLFRGASK